MLRKHWSDNLKYQWRIKRASENSTENYLYLIRSVLKLLKRLPYLTETSLVIFGLFSCFKVIFNPWKRLFLNDSDCFLLSGCIRVWCQEITLKWSLRFLSFTLPPTAIHLPFFLFPLAGIKRRDDRFSSTASHNRAVREYKSAAHGHCQAQPSWGRWILFISENRLTLLTKFHNTDPTATKVYLRQLFSFLCWTKFTDFLFCTRQVLD